MHKYQFSRKWATCLLMLWIGLSATWAGAQPKPSRTPATAPASGANAAASISQDSVQEVRPELLKLLKMTPALTGAVAQDPSLLSDQQYVARTNPALAQFLEVHPEVARNPEFYLFANLPGNDRVRGLQREVWPEMIRDYHRTAWSDIAPVLGILGVAGAILWLIRLFLDNSRWKRSLKVQNEMQTRLLDKFASNQELIAYLETEAGKRILQTPAIPSENETGVRPNGMLGRILMPLEFGVVLISVGIGMDGLILIAPPLVRALGIGLCLAALVSWLIARRYGLLPQTGAKQDVQEQR